ncbi:MAG: hypothetical protein JXB07_12695 [Anaerolineae bacterium]|nr:hypothetical protein [Anaerolineae bacterium]
MDKEEAIWLAELIVEAAADLEDSPGLLIEVESKTSQWVQVLIEQDEESRQISGFALNFPYTDHSGDPLIVLEAAGLKLPPDTRALEWEDDGFATIWIRPDIPLVALALFANDILTRVVGAQVDAPITVRLEYGY